MRAIVPVGSLLVRTKEQVFGQKDYWIKEYAKYVRDGTLGISNGIDMANSVVVCELSRKWTYNVVLLVLSPMGVLYAFSGAYKTQDGKITFDEFTVVPPDRG